MGIECMPHTQHTITRVASRGSGEGCRYRAIQQYRSEVRVSSKGNKSVQVVCVSQGVKGSCTNKGKARRVYSTSHNTKVTHIQRGQAGTPQKGNKARQQWQRSAKVLLSPPKGREGGCSPGARDKLAHTRK